MALYESVFIARQDLSCEDVDNLTNNLSKTITDNGGKVVSTEYWGLRSLAYKINKNGRGHYVLLNIEAENKALEEFTRVIGFNEDVVRSSVFKVKEHGENSRLAVAKNAKGHKEGKTIEYSASEEDEKVKKLVINNI